MIEINLLRQRKIGKVVNVLGVDLKEIKFPILILAIVISFLPDFLLYPIWDGQIAERSQELLTKKTTLTKLDRFIQENNDLDRKLEAYNRQIEDLKKRTIQVDAIVSKKISPKLLLEKLAKDAPKELWFNKLSISENSEISIVGGSTNYKSIGEFLHLLNESKFFEGSLILVNSETIEEEEQSIKRRVEKFDIKGPVKTFDPWR